MKNAMADVGDRCEGDTRVLQGSSAPVWLTEASVLRAKLTLVFLSDGSAQVRHQRKGRGRGEDEGGAGSEIHGPRPASLSHSSGPLGGLTRHTSPKDLCSQSLSLTTFLHGAPLRPRKAVPSLPASQGENQMLSEGEALAGLCSSERQVAWCTQALRHSSMHSKQFRNLENFSPPGVEQVGIGDPDNTKRNSAR